MGACTWGVTSVVYITDQPVCICSCSKCKFTVRGILLWRVTISSQLSADWSCGTDLIEWEWQ